MCHPACAQRTEPCGACLRVTVLFCWHALHPCTAVGTSKHRRVGFVRALTRARTGAGIAKALGSAGATVYVTARSSKRTSHGSARPGVIEDTAAEVSARGGKGIPVLCDHTNAQQVCLGSFLCAESRCRAQRALHSRACAKCACVHVPAAHNSPAPSHERSVARDASVRTRRRPGAASPA